MCVRNRKVKLSSSALIGVTLGLLVCISFFGRRSTSQVVNTPVSFDFGGHIFNVPAEFIVKYYDQVSSNNTMGLLLEMLWPDLVPVSRAPAKAEGGAFGRNLITVGLSYNGPSYSGKRLAKAFMSLGFSSSGSEPLSGYNVYTITADQDLYIAKDYDVMPYTIICSRPSPRPGDRRLPSCWTVQELETAIYPVKSDQRYPLTMKYTFAKALLPQVASINLQLTKMVDEWKAH